MKNVPYEQIVEYLRSKFPEEACGLLIETEGKPVFTPCENVTDQADRTKHFAISGADYREASKLGNVIAVVHSHTTEPTRASPSDTEAQKRSGVPWLIVGLQEACPELLWLDSPKEANALYGRPYIWHVNDCYAFIRDWYLFNYDMVLPDFFRRRRFWEDGEELYLDNFHKVGFVEVPWEQMQKGDVILMTLVDNKVTTHGAVYLGDNRIGHHLIKRPSCIDVYNEYYIERTTKVVRHKDRIQHENNNTARRTG